MRRFTLIELLVIIAVITILAVMFLPARQQARERARANAGINDFRIIGTVGTSNLQHFQAPRIHTFTVTISDFELFLKG